MLTACLVVLFVAAPMIEATLCTNEEAVATSTHDPSVAVGVDVQKVAIDHAPAGKSPAAPDSGMGSCLHGHCHHGQFAAVLPVLEPAEVTSVDAPGLPLAALRLASADLSQDKPPPRA